MLLFLTVPERRQTLSQDFVYHTSNSTLLHFGPQDLWMQNTLSSPLLMHRAASLLIAVVQPQLQVVEVAENAFLYTTVCCENKHQGVNERVCPVLSGILLVLKLFFILLSNSYNPNPLNQALKLTFSPSPSLPLLSLYPLPPFLPTTLSVSVSLSQRSFCHQECHYKPLLVIPLGTLTA